jgi:predicted P-loop ATPase
MSLAAPQFSEIPEALRLRAQWLLWRAEQKKGERKPRKVPYYADGGRRSGTQGDEKDRGRLVSFEAVQRAHAAGKYTGVGFAFLPGDGLIGVDLDDAIDAETGEIDPRAQNIVGACDSWTEISQSGRGLHVYLRGQTETHKVNARDGKLGLEIFCGSQFFVVTGRTWPGAKAQVREAGPKLLARLHKTVQALREGDAPKPARTPRPAAPLPQGPGRRAELVDALAATRAADCDYDRWVSVGMILRAELGDAEGFVHWDRWSALDADRYPGTAELARKWRSFGDCQGGDLVFALARDAGWRPNRRPARPARANVKPAGGGDKVPPTSSDGQGGGDDPPELRFPFVNDKGKPRGIRENVYYALAADPVLKGLVSFDAFSELHVKARPTPWPAPGPDWHTIDDLHLANYLAHRHRLVVASPEVIQQAVDMAARDNPRHPLRDWLRGLRHDGVERLDHWLVDYLGATDSLYVRAAGRMFLIGMVARVMKPGCKMDYALILQGQQGKGKSTAFRELAKPWFADTPFRIGDRDALMSVQGVWLYEFSELDALGKAEETAIKAFITSVQDRFRAPYGTRMLNVPRRVVFGGTTNAEEFLRDATGGRRFWPVKTGEMNIEGLVAVRDQLFAEAVALFDAGGRWYPTPEEERAWFAPEQERWKLVDVWADYLRAYVDSGLVRDIDEDGLQIPERERQANADRDFFSTQELMARALHIDAGRIDNAKQMQRRIAQCMHEIRFTAHRQAEGKRKRGYLRLPPEALATDPNPIAHNAPTRAPDAEMRARAALEGGQVNL